VTGVDGIERVDLGTLGGVDNITVDDLSDTDLTHVDNRLGRRATAPALLSVAPGKDSASRRAAEALLGERGVDSHEREVDCE
jgi:hypothetical protein